MTKTLRLALVLILSGSNGLVSLPIQAGENENESDGSPLAFVYGGDCTQLSRLNHNEILAITHPAHGDDFDRFCVVHGIYSCSDYKALLGGAGTLESNDSFGCNFIPAPH